MLKISICGHGGCGKDTAAEMLAEMTPMRYVMGTSKFAADIVWEKWGKLNPHYGWKNASECWEARRDHRKKWAEIIREYNQADPVQLYRDCLAAQELLTGIRWRNEQQACRVAGIVDLWVWLDRDVPVDPTMDFGPEQCDIVIPNNGSKLALKRRLFALSQTWKYDQQPNLPN